MRVLVSGSRKYDNWKHVWEELSKLENVECIIHGGAKGVDTWAGKWARRNDVIEEEYLADWRILGKSAGPVRNARMLKEGKPDMVMAFLSKDSRGTADMITQSRRYGIEPLVFLI